MPNRLVAIVGVGKIAHDQHVPAIDASPDWALAATVSRAGSAEGIPPFPAFDPPYAVGLIELAEGVRIVSNVVGVPADEVRIGMPVRLEFLRADAEYELPVFRAFEGGEA